MIRYFDHRESEGREILILPGFGCSHSACTFCDYWRDKVGTIRKARVIWEEELKKIKGGYKLEVFMSGSVSEVPILLLWLLKDTIWHKNIIGTNLLFEQRWEFRRSNSVIQEMFSPIGVEIWTGIESWDDRERNEVLNKGLPSEDIYPKDVMKWFSGAFFLIGFPGQKKDNIIKTVITNMEHEIKAKYNIYTEAWGIEPDIKLIEWFRIEFGYILKNRINWQGAYEYERPDCSSATQI